ncbi:TIGR04283 family arsenosugar biosynthesis glycosyltransferase [Geothrix fermentans]|jgi:rSAM/selenodomain-associated transferase 2|uniref:TIGR04283 family arsenosugar biosynthesis glycosyltransferase n=1 Tax=Geothrix fermentans TaxID=44676 RepID=UPI0003FD4AF6|nr:TIGR04283 family arsenosugar biosynthesis glycosyltransferase [Geothrix fermentans]
MALISVIIPTLDEATQIGPCLDQFAAQLGDWELVVVDGGSRDGTVALAEARGARVIQASGGRGPQMNAGAAAAEGWILLFLHADGRLPPHASRLIHRILACPGIAAGAFRVRHQPHRWTGTWKARLLRLADLRSRYTRRPYGDQGLFMNRSIFQAAGGFPPRPLMEDLAMARRLARLGRVHTVREEVRTSGRRFESAPIRAFLCMNTFPVLDRLGVSPERLKRWYGNPR